jgi:lipopolysaccharide export system permease protein
MLRIDRYFISELTLPSIVGFLIMLMLLIGNKLYALLEYLYRGHATASDIGLTLLYFLPSVLMMAVPAALLLGTSLTINRLEHDREIMSLRMVGKRLSRLMAPIILIGIAFVGLMFIFQEKVIPFTSHQAEIIKQKLIYGSPVAFVQEDLVFRVGKAGNEDSIYVHRVDRINDILYGVIVYKHMGDNFPSIISIPVARNVDDQWILERDPVTHEGARVYSFNKKGQLSSYMEAVGPDKAGFLKISRDLMNFTRIKSADEMTFRELLDLKNGVRGTGIGLPEDIVLSDKSLTYYLHSKFSVPIAALVAVLIAIPLAVRFGRSGGYVGLLLSVVVAFFFVISQQWAHVLVDGNYINPIFAAWAPDIVFGVTGVILLALQE